MGRDSNAPRHFARHLTDLTGLEWLPVPKGATTGPSIYALDRKIRWSANILRAYPGGFYGRTRTQRSFRDYEQQWENVLRSRNWAEDLAPLVAPLLLEDHNTWAATVAECLESLRMSTILALFGRDALPDRQREPDPAFVRGALRDVSVEDQRLSFEGQELPPGFSLQVQGDRIRSRWAGMRMGADSWSSWDGKEATRRLAWEEFYCRLPSFTTGV